MLGSLELEGARRLGEPRGFWRAGEAAGTRWWVGQAGGAVGEGLGAEGWAACELGVRGWWWTVGGKERLREAGGLSGD